MFDNDDPRVRRRTDEPVRMLPRSRSLEAGLHVVTDGDGCVERVVALGVGSCGVLQRTVYPQLDGLVGATFRTANQLARNRLAADMDRQVRVADEDCGVG